MSEFEDTGLLREAFSGQTAPPPEKPRTLGQFIDAMDDATSNISQATFASGAFHAQPANPSTGRTYSQIIGTPYIDTEERAFFLGQQAEINRATGVGGEFGVGTFDDSALNFLRGFVEEQEQEFIELNRQFGINQLEVDDAFQSARLPGAFQMFANPIGPLPPDLGPDPFGGIEFETQDVFGGPAPSPIESFRTVGGNTAFRDVTRPGFTSDALGAITSGAETLFRQPGFSEFGQGVENVLGMRPAVGVSPGGGTVTGPTLGQSLAAPSQTSPELDAARRFTSGVLGEVPVVGGALADVNNLFFPRSPYELLLEGTTLGLAGDIADLNRFRNVIQRGGRNLGESIVRGTFPEDPILRGVGGGGGPEDLARQSIREGQLSVDFSRQGVGPEGLSARDPLGRAVADEPPLSALEPNAPTGTPSRYITRADGVREAPNSENIVDAIGRYMVRPSTQRRLTPEFIAENPQAVINDILNARTRGGARLMQGVTPDEIGDAMMSLSPRIDDLTSAGNILDGAAQTVQPFGAGSGDSGDIFAREMAASGGGGRRGRGGTGFLEDLGNAMRQAAAGGDLSFALRQGGLNLRHGREYLHSIGSAYRALGDEAYALARNAEIRAAAPDELFITAIPGEDFLSVSRPISVREETIASEFVGSLPGFKQTGRANGILLNEQRLGIYDLVQKAWERESGLQGFINRTLSRADDSDALARYINRTTGRGTLGPLEDTFISDALGIGLFSPRYLASRPQALLNMMNWQNPRVALEAWKDFGFYVGGTAALLGLADTAGLGSVNLDPTNANFGKLKIGNTRIDPWLGFQQLARYSSLIATGAWDGDWDEATRTMERFLRTKLAPLPGTVYDLTRGEGKDLIGRDITPKSLAISLTPIWVQGILEYALDGDSALAIESLISAPLEIAGGGVQVYETRSEVRDKVSQELFGKDYRELTNDLQLKVNADDRVAKHDSAITKLNKEIRADYEERAGQIDARPNGSEKRRAYDSLVQQLANARPDSDFTPEDYDKLTEPEQAERDYFAIFDNEELFDVTGEMDFALYEQLLAEWQEKWPQFSREQVSPSRPLSPGHEELLSDRKAITDSGWWEAHQTGFDYVKRNGSEDARSALADFATYDEWRDYAINFLMERDNSESEAEEKFFELVGRYDMHRWINNAQGLVLSRNPQIVELLQKWGYSLNEAELEIARKLGGIE